jgi:large subunit ribosomal protein L23
MMRAPTEVIERPLVTEKTHKMAERRTYAFAVAKDATKAEIRRAVEELFSVKVERVRTLVLKGKRKRMRNFRTFGRRKDWKKAYVTLQEGHRLDLI